MATPAGRELLLQLINSGSAAPPEPSSLDPSLHYALGCSLFTQGRTDEALASFCRALQLKPDFAAALCNLGDVMLVKSRFDEAAACYLESLALAPHQPAACHKLGLALQSSGRPDEALTYYTQALSLDPGLAIAHCSMGDIHFSRGDLTLAADSYRKAIGIKPDFWEALNNLGNILKIQGDREEAERCFRDALEINGNSALVHFNLAAVLMKRGEIAGAIKSYRDAIACKPDYVDAYINLGNALRSQGNDNEAAACYRKAISLDSASALAHFNLGLTWMELGEFAKAAESYRQAIACKPDYIEAHCNLGVALKQLGQLDEALAHYEKALEISPGWVNAIYNIGIICEMAGQTNMAEAWYRRALEIDPGNVSAHINLATLLLKAGRHEEARQHRDLAYKKQCVFVTRAPEAARTVLMLLYVGDGNIHYHHLFSPRENNVIEWMIEYSTPDQYRQLPAYDIVFNAIGDPDISAPAARPVADFLAHCDKPVLNPPSAVQRTARHLIPELFRGMDGIYIPPVWRVDLCAPDWHANEEFRFPLLVRPLGSQGGEGVVLIEDREALAKIRPAASSIVYLTAYQDYRSPDGCYRKYRVVFVDRKPYPYHLAISPNWMVHYMTADMPAHPWKLEEEMRFLQDPAGVFGERGMSCLEEIGRRMDLDYAGIDFSLMPDGRLLVFEANATMLVHLEAEDERLFHKNPYVQKIFDAFSAHVASRCKDAA